MAGASVDSDALRGVRNSFYLGLYKKTIEECVVVSRTHRELAPYAEIYSNRAILELQPEQVFKTISSSAPTGLQAIKQYATYRTAADETLKDVVVGQVGEWLSSELTKKDDTLQLIGAYIYFEEKNYKEALKLLRDPGENLEKLALTVEIYLKIDRVDLASKAAQAMGVIDDDDTLTQLATAWCYIAQGGDKLAEAAIVLQDLLDKFGPSPKILTTLAVCEMHTKNWSSAFTHLKQARDLAVASKEPVSGETLVNSAICCTHLRKPEIEEKVKAELTSSHPTHPWLRRAADMEALFDRHARTYAPAATAAAAAAATASPIVTGAGAGPARSSSSSSSSSSASPTSS